MMHTYTTINGYQPEPPWLRTGEIHPGQTKSRGCDEGPKRQINRKIGRSGKIAEECGKVQTVTDNFQTTKVEVRTNAVSLQTCFVGFKMRSAVLETCFGNLKTSKEDFQMSIVKHQISSGYLETGMGNLKISTDDLETRFVILEMSYGDEETCFGKHEMKKTIVVNNADAALRASTVKYNREEHKEAAKDREE